MTLPIFRDNVLSWRSTHDTVHESSALVLNHVVQEAQHTEYAIVHDTGMHSPSCQNACLI